MVSPNLSTPKIMFLCSKLLYYSIWHCRNINCDLSNMLTQSTSKDEQHGVISQFWIQRVIDIIPAQIGNFIMVFLLLLSLYGWCKFLILKKPSFLLEFSHYIGLPIAFFFIPNIKYNGDISNQTILWRIIPLILLTVTVVSKIQLLHLLHSSPSLNTLAAYNIYQPFFPIVRLLLILLANIFLAPEIQLYIIIITQLVISFYHYYYAIYFFPDIQWCSIVSRLWSWASILQAVLVSYGIHEAKIIDTIAIFTILIGLFPQKLFIKILEMKGQRILNRMYTQRAKDYGLLLIPYYIDVNSEQQTSCLSKLYSNQFRLKISFKIQQKNNRLVFKNKNQPAEPKEKFDCNSIPHTIRSSCAPNNRRLPKPQKYIKYFLKQQCIFARMSQYSFRSLYYLIYIVLNTEYLNQVSIYQMYYQLLIHSKGKHHFVAQILMSNLFDILKNRINAGPNKGLYIEGIVRYDQLYGLFGQYAKNERNFLGIMSEYEPENDRFKNYICRKQDIKEKIETCLQFLQFNHPLSQSLASKIYIIQSHIDNNDILSKRNLVKNLNKISAKKTKVIHFDLKNNDEDQAIFMCGWRSGKVTDILYFNRKFSFETEAEGSDKIKLKDLLPVYWRDTHQSKTQCLHELQLTPLHNSDTTYYIQSLSTHKILQSKQLKVLPYFELNNEVFLLVKMRIQNSQQISIKLKPSNYMYEMEDQSENTGKGEEITSGFLKQNNSTQKRLFKSNRDISFKHEIYEDEDCNMVQICEKVVQIFGKQYVITAKNKRMQIFTKNLIKSEMVINMSEDIKAVIKLASIGNQIRTQTFEKSKTKVNLFSQISFVMILKILILCCIFAAGATSAGISFASYTEMISKSATLKFRYFQISVIVTSFFQSFINFNCNQHLRNQQKQPFKKMLDKDLIEIRAVYDNYLEAIHQMANKEQFLQPIYRTYLSLDIEQRMKNNSIIQHATIMNMLLDSSIQMIKNEECGNWVIKELYSILKMQQSMIRDEKYLEYRVMKQTAQMLKKAINQSELVFWIVEFFTVLAPILAYIIFWCYKIKIENILTKPLQMPLSQLVNFYQNIKNIMKFLQRQKQNHQISQKSLGDSVSITAHSQLFESNLSKTESFESTELNSNETNKRKTKGQFYHHYPMITVLVGTHLFTVLICSLKLFVAKNVVISSLEDKLLKYSEFTQFNTNLLGMYNQVIEVASYQDILSENQKLRIYANVNLTRKWINDFDIKNALEQMLIDPQNTAKTLFENPCPYLKDCPKIYNTQNPYPVELSYFMTSFTRLISHLDWESNIKQLQKDQQLVALIGETYLSVHSIVQIVYWISKTNLHSVEIILNSTQIWMVLSYFSIGCFCIIIIGETFYILVTGVSYGRQILAILNSKFMMSSKVFSYEINSIWYRTNFAKDLIILHAD